MFEKYGGKSLLRQPGSSLLILLLSLLVAAVLGTSLGLRSQVEQTIRDCSNRYITLGIVDYYSGEEVTDPSVLADYAARLDDLVLPAQVQSWAPTQEALGWFPAFDADVSPLWAMNEAVLLVRATQTQRSGENASAVVEQELFSMRKMEKKIVALANTALEPGMLYFVRGAWHKALPGTYATLEPDAPLLALGASEAGDVPGSEAFFDRAAELTARRTGFTLRASACFSTFQPFQQGQLSLSDGRMITDQEAAAGEPVLMLSERMAKNLGISVGDTLRLCAAAADRCQIPEGYDPSEGPDLDTDYTVVGVFNDYTGWNETVLIPPVPGLDMTQNHANPVLGQFLLDNDGAASFEQWAKENLPGGLRLTIEDQGYREVIGPLQTIRILTRLIALACLLAGLGFLLLCAWLFVHRQRAGIVVMHRLGVGRSGILRYCLAGMLALTLPGMAAGSLLSRFLCGRIAARLANRLAAAQTLNYSYSSTRQALAAAAGMLQADAPLQVFLRIGVLSCLAMLLLTALFALSAVPSLHRPGARRQGRTKTRTRILHTPISYAWLSEFRGGGRTLLVLLMPLLAALALNAMSASQEKTRQELDRLAEESTVRGMVTDLYGSSYGSLMVRYRDLEDLLALEEVRSATMTFAAEHFAYAGKWEPGTGLGDDFVMPEFAYNEYGQERLMAKYRDYPQLISANGLDDAPAFLYSGEPVISWLPPFDSSMLQASYGYSAITVGPNPSSFPEETASDPERRKSESEALVRMQINAYVYPNMWCPCIVSTAFLQEHGLALGDSFLITYPASEGYCFVVLLRAVGSYVKLNGPDNIYLPFSLVFDYWDHWERRVNSAVFRFSCRDLDGLKQKLRDLGFTETGDQSGVRRPFLLEDRTYLNLRSNLEQRLLYMERVFFAAALLLLILAPLLGVLTALTRRRELRLMRGLGAAGPVAFGSVFLGPAGSCLIGAMLGAVICRLAGWETPLGFAQSAAFAALWLLGFGVSIACIDRKGGNVSWRFSN